MMKPPKVTRAWAVWLDWEKIDRKKYKARGAWFRAWRCVPDLYRTRKEARRNASLSFERVVQVEIRVAR